jgi:hypothetical protein
MLLEELIHDAMIEERRKTLACCRMHACRVCLLCLLWFWGASQSGGRLHYVLKDMYLILICMMRTQHNSGPTSHLEPFGLFKMSCEMLFAKEEEQ